MQSLSFDSGLQSFSQWVDYLPVTNHTDRYQYQYHHHNNNNDDTDDEKAIVHMEMEEIDGVNPCSAPDVSSVSTVQKRVSLDATETWNGDEEDDDLLDDPSRAGANYPNDDNDDDDDMSMMILDWPYELHQDDEDIVDVNNNNETAKDATLLSPTLLLMMDDVDVDDVDTTCFLTPPADLLLGLDDCSVDNDVVVNDQDVEILIQDNDGLDNTFGTEDFGNNHLPEVPSPPPPLLSSSSSSPAATTEMHDLFQQRRRLLAASMQRTRESRQYMFVSGHIQQRAKLTQVLSDIEKSSRQIHYHFIKTNAKTAANNDAQETIAAVTTPETKDETTSNTTTTTEETPTAVQAV